MEASENIRPPRIIQWFIDTRALWPVPKLTRSQDEVQVLKTVAAKELSLLSESEQESILRFYHIRDAKTKLASHLLKHFVITKYGNVRWIQSVVSQGEEGKPFSVSPNQARSSDISSNAETTRLDFNVSHQAGIVSLIAAVNFPGKVDLGTDVVCVNERREKDHAYIDREGFFAWVDMHADVFASSEPSEMKVGPVAVDLRIRGATLAGYGMDAISRCQWRDKVLSVKVVGGDGQHHVVKVDSTAVVQGKLRRFYAFWCLREAYVKMTGEALAAPWLKELEILGVVAPVSGVTGVTGVREGDEGGDMSEGEVKRDFSITFKGSRVTDVRMELAAFGEQYMIAGAIRVPEGPSIEMGKWVELDLGEMLELAEGSW